MKIQLISDLHLEYYQNPKLEDFVTPSAPHLIIAGDLGYPDHPSYRTFIDQCSKAYESVILISGNHEYYRYGGATLLNMEEVETEINKVVKDFENVHYLQNNEYILGDYIILGTTLWTYIPNSRKYLIEKSLNDYNHIYSIYGTKITADETNALHEKSVKWLDKKINEYHDKKVIVLTHHLSTEKLIAPMYKGSPINSGFVTHLEPLMKPNVKYWLCGHSHNQMDIVVRDCRCILNAFGYPHENKGTSNYKKDLVIDLD